MLALLVFGLGILVSSSPWASKSEAAPVFSSKEHASEPITVTAIVPVWQVVTVNEGLEVVSVLSNGRKEGEVYFVKDSVVLKECPECEAAYSLLKPKLDFSRPGILFRQ
ncbi:MAG: hypothetical protein K0S20_259 [Patescibacteria group bacterium]|nr:hypothetical protein [Patescibacteria group bacterium]